MQMTVFCLLVKWERNFPLA